MKKRDYSKEYSEYNKWKFISTISIFPTFFFLYGHLMMIGFSSSAIQIPIVWTMFLILSLSFCFYSWYKYLTNPYRKDLVSGNLKEETLFLGEYSFIAKEAYKNYSSNRAGVTESKTYYYLIFDGLPNIRVNKKWYLKYIEDHQREFSLLFDLVTIDNEPSALVIKTPSYGEEFHKKYLYTFEMNEVLKKIKKKRN